MTKIIKVMGGLGNQMFQYALYVKLKNIGIAAYLDDHEIIKYGNEHNGLELHRSFNIFYDRLPFTLKINYYIWKLIQIIMVKIKGNGELPYFYMDDFSGKLDGLLEKQHKYLIGDWQNQKMFTDIRAKLIEEFQFNIQNLSKDNLYMDHQIKWSEAISIHVRRGDYLLHENRLQICTIEYYKSGVSYILSKVPNAKFFVFSDDSEWIRDNFGWFDYELIDWNTGEDSYIDMYLMSICRHNIIANSTFSWWGAWLNRNESKIVVSPQMWFQDKENSLILEDWVAISSDGMIIE